MKHELLVRAITEIDDDLINDAHTPPKSNIIHWQKWSSLAACFVLLISAAFLFFLGNGTSITVFEEKLDYKPIVISESNAVTTAHRISGEPTAYFTVPLELEVKSKTSIWVSSGTMQIFDINTNVLLYEGDRFDTHDDVLIIWIVEASPDVTRFEMNINSDRSNDTVILNYTDDRQWIIRKITK